MYVNVKQTRLVCTKDLKKNVKLTKTQSALVHVLEKYPYKCEGISLADITQTRQCHIDTSSDAKVNTIWIQTKNIMHPFTSGHSASDNLTD